MDILDTVTTYWGWTGIEPERVIAINEFGNVLMKDTQGKFWRLCPEDLYCEVIADNDDDYNELVKDEEFNQDWFMETMVQKALDKYGPLEDGLKFHMLEPGALGGKYAVFNVKAIQIERIIQFSGDLAQQLHRSGGKKVNYKPLS